MERYEIQEQYLQWMQNQVSDKKHPAKNYISLFKFLHETEFNYTIPRDGNRAEDGVDLRYAFGQEMNYPNAVITDALDYCECSVLEMMIALSRRCMNMMVGCNFEADGLGFWFWGMIRNLEIEDQTDDNFSPLKVDQAMTRLLNHEYEEDGTGGLFTVKNYTRDMRGVEIWYQFCWYLNELLDAS